MKPGDRIPTEKELMDQFQVSKITVANALTGLANEKLIARVPGKGSFVAEETDSASVASTQATTIKGREGTLSTGMIGIIVPSIHDYFAIRLVEGIEQALREEGYRSMIMFTHGKVDKEKDVIKEMKALGAEGLLIFPVDEENYNEEILGMKLSGFPFVLMDRYLPGSRHIILLQMADGARGWLWSIYGSLDTGISLFARIHLFRQLRFRSGSKVILRL